jgi:hypothetical protein
MAFFVAPELRCQPSALRLELKRPDVYAAEKVPCALAADGRRYQAVLERVAVVIS